MDNRPNFPSKLCPKCGAFIHARTQKHEECGWVGNAKTVVKRRKKTKKKSRPKEAVAPARAIAITIPDIQAVKKVVNRIGAAKVRELAEVLAQ